jgi:hypothetical protein
MVLSLNKNQHQHAAINALKKNDMASTILKALMTLFVVQGLIKFCVFFFIKYDVRRKQLDKSYGNKATATKYFDNIILAVLALLTHFAN